MIRSAIAALLLMASAAHSQDRRPSHCIAIADAAPGISYIHKASYSDPVPQFSVRISYIDHSMFLIQTAGGLGAVTDFNGYTGIHGFVPDVVTMNIGHETHYTLSPDPRIPHPLEGWGGPDGPADHHLNLGEMLVRNVTTDIRSRFGGAPVSNGNSIFVFEVEGLCIGHLGHLHHEPTDEQYAALGRMDVVMAAVDGGMTLPTDVMVKIMKRLKASVVLPMHWFGRYTLDEFISGMSDEFAVERTGMSHYMVSLRTLPKVPTIVVLEPDYPASFGYDD